MAHDLDDTVIHPPRPVPASLVAPAGEIDLDDTVLGVGTTIPSAVALPTGATHSRLNGFYSFRVGVHEPVMLDLPVYVGRKPSSPRIVTGALPRLVRVASPHKEVSATHLEVRQLGGSVVITDLRTTNGSVVMLPGSIPRRLLQGESVVVSPGTLVDIGDENVLQILPMQRVTVS